MKKILILYAKYGGGHLSAANAINTYIKENYSDIADVKNIDCIEFISPFFSKASTGAYTKIVQKAPKLWKKLYYGARNNFISPISTRLNKVMSKKLSKLFKEYSPDIVISVHPFASQMSNILKKKGLNCTLATVFTDFATHPQWLVGNEYCDYFFVSNANMKLDLINNYSVPENKIFVVGIPLAPAFSLPIDDNATYEKYNLNRDKKLILFFGGGEFGLCQKVTIQLLKSLTKFMYEYQIVAISGKNEELHNKFLEISNDLNNNDLHVLSYTTDVPALMHISSLVVTKPGGLTSSESLASHLPIIIINPIPGQEEENAEFLENSGVAVWAKTNDDIDTIIDKILRDGHELEIMREKCVSVAKPHATRDICEILLNTK
ncbi:MAG: glycosyltransferase [Clostridia bacterium]|nr:glycosyltransferase [Clostridia bacterium]